jgi:hypothetical protein
MAEKMKQCISNMAVEESAPAIAITISRQRPAVQERAAHAALGHFPDFGFLLHRE